MQYLPMYITVSVIGDMMEIFTLMNALFAIGSLAVFFSYSRLSWVKSRSFALRWAFLSLGGVEQVLDAEQELLHRDARAPPLVLVQDAPGTPCRWGKCSGGRTRRGSGTSGVCSGNPR